MAQKFTDAFVKLPLHDGNEDDCRAVRNRFVHTLHELFWDYRLVSLTQASH